MSFLLTDEKEAKPIVRLREDIMEQKTTQRDEPKGWGECSRQSARSVLRGLIGAKKTEWEGLRILDDAIGWDSLSKEDEATLWSLFCRLKT